MLTHIDKEILINAYQIYRKGNLQKSRDAIHFLSFINSESNVRIYGTDNLEKNNILSPFLAGRGKTEIKPVSCKFSECKVEIDPDNPYQLFFLDVEDKGQREKLEKEIKYLLAFKDNYENVFEEFKSEPPITVDKDGNVDEYDELMLLKSWEQILPDLPITEIVISDPYILIDDEQLPLENNLFSLLTAIKTKYEIKSILVFTTIKDINELYSIRQKAQKIFGHKTICGFILFQEEEEQHDRHIITNYKHIKLGSSGRYFGKDGNINVKKKSSINTHSYYQKKHFQEASNTLNGLNNTLKGLQLKGKLPGFIKSRLLDYNNFSNNEKTQP